MLAAGKGVPPCPPVLPEFAAEGRGLTPYSLTYWKRRWYSRIDSLTDPKHFTSLSLRMPGVVPFRGASRAIPRFWALILSRATFRFVRGQCLLVALAVCWSVASPVAWAQNALAGKKSEITKMLRDGKVEQPLFNDYFNKFLLPQFTAGQATSVDTYPRLRKELKIFSNTGKGDALKDFNKLVLAGMKDILIKPNDQAAKVNAMLVLGDLTEMDGDGRPRPLADSLALLSAAAASPKFPDAVKLVAMIGLDRYAAAGAIPAEKQTSLSQMCRQLLQQAEPPAGRTKSGHNWMRRSAAQFLARLGSPGPNDSVLNAMLDIAADPQAPVTLRCEMAHCIGQLKIPAGTKADLRALANTLGHQAVEICSKEIDRAIDEKQPASRRVLMYSVSSAREGVERLQSAAAGTDHSKFVAETAAKLKAMYLELDDLDLPDEGVAEALSTQIDELRTLLGPPVPTARQKDAVAAAPGAEKPIEPVKQ